MKYNQESINFWRENWRKNIIPLPVKYPEGSQNIALLKEAVGNSVVREIGCGPGRLASLFDHEMYCGYDISAGAVQKAKEENPRHRFYEWDFSELTPAETTL